ncbi:hypothetical protein TSEDIMI_10348 [Tenacibaculum sediminilitoris]
MKNIPLLILTLILIASCNSKQTSSELEKLTEKEKQISDLQTQIENLENKHVGFPSLGHLKIRQIIII